MRETVRYVPILKAREGEFAALRLLPLSRRSRILPLIELLPPRWDFETEAPTAGMDEHAARIAPRVRRSWAPECPIILDGQHIDNDESSAANVYPLDRIFDDCRMRQVRAIPATGLNRTAKYLESVRRVSALDQRGVCVRLQVRDLGADAKLDEVLKELTETAGVSPPQVDLILDVEAVTESEEAQLALALRGILRRLPWVSDWRSLALSGSAFPENLAGLPADKRSAIPRVEWTLWKTVLSDRQSIPRRPDFSDYGITHSHPVEVNPRGMKMSANLRYTSEDAWAIFRGRDVNAHGYEQFRRLCGMLVESDEFCGADFSGGDRMIESCASGRGGTGNATTWREMGTSHHIEFVLRQLEAVSRGTSRAA